MSLPVYIAGLGAISAIGNNVAQNLAAFKSGKAGMADITYLKTRYEHDIPAAEVKFSNEQLAAMTGFPAHMSRTAMLSSIAAKEALDDSGVKNIEGLRIGFISANTVGGMDKSEDFLRRLFKR